MIQEVETAVPAFVGYTERAQRNGADLRGEPVRVSSLLEYEALFGGAEPEKNISVTITDVLRNGAMEDRAVTVAAETSSPYIMYYALQMYFANRGAPCYIVSVGNYGDAINAGDADQGLRMGIDRLEKVDEVTIIVLPDAVSLEVEEYYKLIEYTLSQCARLRDRILIGDVLQKASDPAADVKAMSDSLPADPDMLGYGALYYPYLRTSLKYLPSEADVKVTHIADSVNETTLSALAGYDPELYSLVKTEINKLEVVLPPSSSVAGVCCGIDSAAGVWKAPAGVALRFVNTPDVKITDPHQTELNRKSVNAIRFFTGKGVLVWGSRTLAVNDNEWKYLPVRRFFNFVEESVKKGCQWALSEPNDTDTWIRVKAMTENFLIKQWKAGALSGVKPEQAFFVKVGLGVTMTEQDILEGRMIIEIGMAMIRPAEFIILRICQQMQER